MIKEFRTNSPSCQSYLNLLSRRGLWQKEKIKIVTAILDKVKRHGDKAILELTRRYNGAALTLKSLMVSKSELSRAIREIPDKDKSLLTRTKNRLLAYHLKIKPDSWQVKEDGLTLGEIFRPLERVGLYVPAGYRPLVSTLLMLACPARAAGVKEIILVTPPSPSGEINPHLLYTAQLLGIKKIYKIGGAQAIAALAFGTETIPKVQKIAGPGNIYVTLAKKELYGEVGLDLLAGPSEIVILADEKANPQYVAMDLFSQAEHGPDSAAILITTSSLFLKKVKIALEKITDSLPSDHMAKKSLGTYGSLILCSSLSKGLELTNEIAPEHLEIIIKSPKKILPQIKNAGAIFLGPYSPVSLGDYVAGPSHVLPTNRTSRFDQGLTTETFMKRISLISADKQRFLRLAKDGHRLAEMEGLSGHQKSFTIRRS